MSLIKENKSFTSFYPRRVYEISINALLSFSTIIVQGPENLRALTEVLVNICSCLLRLGHFYQTKLFLISKNSFAILNKLNENNRHCGLNNWPFVWYCKLFVRTLNIDFDRLLLPRTYNLLRLRCTYAAISLPR